MIDSQPPRATARPDVVPDDGRVQTRRAQHDRAGAAGLHVVQGSGGLAFDDLTVSEDGTGALVAPEPIWERRAEPFARQGEPREAILRPELPWAWIRPRRLLYLLDILAAAAVLFVFVKLPSSLLLDGLEEAARATVIVSVILAEVALILFMIWDRTYASSDRLSRIDDGAKLIRNILATVLLVGAASLITDGFGYDLDVISLQATVGALLLFYLLLSVNRLAMWRWQRTLFLRGKGLRRVIVLGVEEEAAAFREFLRRRPWLGLKLVGGIRTLERLDDAPLVSAVPPVGRVLGGLSELDTVLAETDAHELVVALDDPEREALPRLLRVLHRGHLPYSVMPTLFERTYRLAPDADYCGVPIFDVEFDPVRRIARLAKRAVDWSVAFAVLLVLSPLLIAVAIAVKVSTPGPVFFRQVRVGSRGRPFTMLKFRTMYADAERRLVEVEHLNCCEGPIFKAPDDPRITRVGRFLRRWSIDELPQAINVLRGEMSLVGPRPPLPREVALYETPHCVRIKGKPGITGLWQVRGRATMSFSEMVTLDREYLEHWSLRLDLAIMWRTLGAVVQRRNAY